jgi:hypothetical protein
MPRPKSTAPAYQFHISGQARVTFAGVVPGIRDSICDNSQDAIRL